MTRETKFGLIIAGSFVCLVGIVVASKMGRTPGPEGETPDSKKLVASVEPDKDLKKVPEPAPVDLTPKPSNATDTLTPQQLLQRELDKQNSLPLPTFSVDPPKGNSPLPLPLPTPPASPIPSPAPIPVAPVPTPSDLLKKGTDSIPVTEFKGFGAVVVEPAPVPLPVAPIKKDGVIPPPSFGGVTPAPVTLDEKKQPTITGVTPAPVAVDVSKPPTFGVKPTPVTFEDKKPPVIGGVAPAPVIGGVAPAPVTFNEKKLPSFPEPAAIVVKPTVPAKPGDLPTFPPLGANNRPEAFPPITPPAPMVGVTEPVKPALPAITTEPKKTPALVTEPIAGATVFPPIPKQPGGAQQTSGVTPAPVAPLTPPIVNRDNPPTPTTPTITIGGVRPAVTMVQQEKVEVRPGETNFAALSKRLYGDPKYADALLAFNRVNHLGVVNGANLTQIPPRLPPGQQVIHPPVGVLERDFARLIESPPANPIAPTAGLAPPVKLSVPSISTPTPTPTPANTTTPLTVGSTPSSDRTRPYTVQNPAGERLRDIAERVLGDPNRWPAIYRLNNVQPQFLIPAGTQLRLPAN